MEFKKFQLNPSAPVFIPSSKQFSYGKNGSHGGTPSGQASGAESYARAGLLMGNTGSSDIQTLDCEEDFSNTAEEFLESIEDLASVEATEQRPDDAFLVRSLAATFPGYSKASICDVYYANNGDMEATVDMLNQLENVASVGNLPDTLDIGDISTSISTDDKNPSSSADPGPSSGH